MARFKLTLEYDGSAFNGWQFQRSIVTVQGKMFDAIKKVFQTDKFELYAAGRTDSGVHALAQIAHLEVETKLTPDQIRMRLNDELPSAISILKVEEAHPKFHARYDAIARSYLYQISTRRTAFGKKLVWWIKDKLDIQKMQEAAKIFEGMHDFSSFGESEKEDASTKVEIRFVNVMELGNSIAIHIVGSHFLWKMVRRMVGVLVEVGRGNLSVYDVETFLTSKSDVPAKLTVPPSGLYLEKVYYKGEKIFTNPPVLLNLYSFNAAKPEEETRKYTPKNNIEKR